MVRRAGLAVALTLLLCAAPAGAQFDGGNPLSGGDPDTNPLSQGAPDMNPLSQGAPDDNPLSGGASDSNPLSQGAPDSNPLSQGAPDSNPLSPGYVSPFDPSNQADPSAQVPQPYAPSYPTYPAPQAAAPVDKHLCVNGRIVGLNVPPPPGQAGNAEAVPCP